ncbi:MAG: CHRD domain-containing protein [Pyrinomonadaceae bacterium]|nr:CHRD domain-containing protein [Pyrinomonadaceae bacterium]
MFRLRTNLLALLVILFAVTAARADTIFFANLTNSQEPPPLIPTLSDRVTPRPASFGTATFVLNDAQTQLTFTATIFNIDFTGIQTPDTFDNLTNAHIHASSNPLFTPPTTAGVVWGFIGAPFNDNNPNDVVVTPFSTGVGGVVSGKWDLLEGNNTTLGAQLANIFAGRSYINFHTVQFGGGEIRGQITATPEPTTMLLLGTGLAGIAAKVRRRRR